MLRIISKLLVLLNHHIISNVLYRYIIFKFIGTQLTNFERRMQQLMENGYTRTQAFEMYQSGSDIVAAEEVSKNYNSNSVDHDDNVVLHGQYEKDQYCCNSNCFLNCGNDEIDSTLPLIYKAIACCCCLFFIGIFLVIFFLFPRGYEITLGPTSFDIKNGLPYKVIQTYKFNNRNYYSATLSNTVVVLTTAMVNEGNSDSFNLGTELYLYSLILFICIYR